MPGRALYECVLLSISNDFFVVLEYSLTIVLVFFTFIIPGSKDIIQVVQTVQSNLQKFHFMEPGSNLTFVLQEHRVHLRQDEKGHVIAFYKITQ